MFDDSRKPFGKIKHNSNSISLVSPDRRSSEWKVWSLFLKSRTRNCLKFRTIFITPLVCQLVSRSLLYRFYFVYFAKWCWNIFLFCFQETINQKNTIFKFVSNWTKLVAFRFTMISVIIISIIIYFYYINHYWINHF